METTSFGERNSGVQVGVNNAPISVFSSAPSSGHSFFCTSNYEAQKNINPPPVKGTCGWFLNHPKFQEWKSKYHENLLWLSADPGCGKSVLSKTLIDDVLTRDTSATICYFFFKDNQEQNNVATAICALLHQIFCAKTDLFKKRAQGAIDQEKERLTSNFESLWKILMSVALDPSSGEIICVLDALDECRQHDRDRLIQELEQFYQMCQKSQNGHVKMKFLVTSRPYGDIERRFCKMTRQFPSIRLAGEEEWEDISQEIDMVMNARVDEFVIERDLAEDIGDALKRRLSEAQNRTYLWLHLTLDFLRDFQGHTKAKILREIDKLPETVDQAYEDILQRCNSRYQEDGKRLLEIIIAAHRPLRLSEIDVALEILPGSTRFDDLDLEGSAKRRQWIRDVCGLFVSVIDSRVFLIHQTAREFLLRQGTGTVVAGTWRRSIDLQNAHLSLAKLCLAYLLFEDFMMNGQQYRPQSIPQEAFLEYSAGHWMSHVKRGHNLGGEWIRKVVLLCEVGDDSVYWISYHEDHRFWKMCQNHDQFERRPSLYWATRWQLTEAVIFLVDEQGMKITEDVIWIAVKIKGGGVPVLKFLLDRTDIKITQSIVEAVARNGENGKALMQVLLDQRGAEIEITEEVVRKATSNRESGEEILSLLLNRRGADIKITEEVLRSTMSNLRNGSRLMKLLLNRGVEIKITEKAYKHATSFWQDEEEIIQLLRNQRAAHPQEADINEADAKQADLRAAEPRKGWMSYFFGS